jgi:hypothetical protein
MKYKLYLIYENTVLSGGDYKIIAVRDGSDLTEYLSKWDKIIDPDKGTITIEGDMDDLEFIIIVNEDYQLSFEEKEKWEPEND